MRTYIAKLDINKATDLDDLSPQLLKELTRQILQPLTSIYNQSVQLNKIPEDWNLAIVKPIIKKGDRRMTSNYRLISLTLGADKILEKIIGEENVQFLEDIYHF